MKITKSTVIKIKATELQALDPITLYIENIEPSKGKIVIECFGKSWSAYWGGMGDKTIESFFSSCGDDYLIGNLLTGESHTEIDYDEIKNAIKKSLFAEYRRISKASLSEEYFDIYQFREDYDLINDSYIETLQDVQKLSEGIQSHINYDTSYECQPKKHTYEYLYLKRIVSATKEILLVETNSIPSILEQEEENAKEVLNEKTIQI